MEFYRDLIKNELFKACSTSYAEYKAAKKITLDDNNNVAKGGTGEKVDLTEKKKKKTEEDAQNYLKYSMPYAQDATRRFYLFFN